jgi:MFS family permease
MLENLQRDVLVLMASRGIRAFAFSYLGVVFAIYLSQLGYSTVTIGLVISTASASGAVLTALWGFLSDRFGRKKILMLLATLTIISNLIYVFFSHLVFILSAVIIANVGAGGSGGGGQGGGPFNPVEQALLAEKCTPENRNHIFSMNAFVGSLMGSLGALVSGLPQYLQESFGWQPVASYKPLFALTIIFSIILIFAYSTINEQHRPRKREKIKARRTARSGFVTKIALLGMVDNLGAGLVGPLISYWFFRRFGVELKSLGFMFFLSYFFAALSFLAAPVLARYLGVVRTMAFSHGLASLIYLVLPLAPSFAIAATMTVGRSFLAYMDNPLRSSFIMGIVRPEDRGAAAGFTTLSRHVPVAVSPTLSAYLMQSFSLNVPIFIGGFLQLFHDCVFYLLFRNVRPPEEEVARG